MKLKLLLLPLLFTVGCDIGDATRDVTAGVVGTTVEVSKETVNGVRDGIEQGRKDARSADDAIVLTEPATIATATRIHVHEVKAHGDGTEVVLAIANITSVPVHLTGLAQDGGALLIDTEGFATALDTSLTLPRTIAVPPNAKVKASMTFDGVPSQAAAVRVWGQDLSTAGALDAGDVASNSD